MRRVVVITEQTVETIVPYATMVIASLVRSVEFIDLPSGRVKVYIDNFEKCESRDAVYFHEAMVDISSGLLVVPSGKKLTRTDIIEACSVIPIDTDFESKAAVAFKHSSNLAEKLVSEYIASGQNPRLDEFLDTAYERLVSDRAFSVLPAPATIHIKETYLDELRIAQGAYAYDVVDLKLGRFIASDFLNTLASDLRVLGVKHRFSVELVKEIVADDGFEYCEFKGSGDYVCDIEGRVWKHGQVTVFVPTKIRHQPTCAEFHTIKQKIYTGYKDSDRSVVKTALSDIAIVIASGSDLEPEMIFSPMSKRFGSMIGYRLVGDEVSTRWIFGDVLTAKNLDLDMFDFEQSS